MKIISKLSFWFSWVALKVRDLFLKLFYLLEFFLFLRLSLKFIGANPSAVVVNLIYKWSDFFVKPFNFIFLDIYWPKEYFIEIATVSAMVGYAILIFIILKLFDSICKH